MRIAHKIFKGLLRIRYFFYVNCDVIVVVWAILNVSLMRCHVYLFPLVPLAWLLVQVDWLDSRFDSFDWLEGCHLRGFDAQISLGLSRVIVRRKCAYHNCDWWSILWAKIVAFVANFIYLNIPRYSGSHPRIWYSYIFILDSIHIWANLGSRLSRLSEKLLD